VGCVKHLLNLGFNCDILNVIQCLFLGDLNEFINYWANLYNKETGKVQEVAQVILEFTGGIFIPL